MKILFTLCYTCLLLFACSRESSELSGPRQNNTLDTSGEQVQLASIMRNRELEPFEILFFRTPLKVKHDIELPEPGAVTAYSLTTAELVEIQRLFSLLSPRRMSGLRFGMPVELVAAEMDGQRIALLYIRIPEDKERPQWVTFFRADGGSWEVLSTGGTSARIWPREP